jgi:hypothetical protein
LGSPEKGAKGATGPAGAQGPAGPAGAKGDAGANGANGAAGPTGPTGTAGAKGATGAAGATGFSGFTETLPSKKAETGTWSISQSNTSSFRNTYTSISFPIPLAAEGVEGSAFAFTQAQTANEEFGKEAGEACTVEAGNPLCIDTGCEGTVTEPTAPPGKLCIYTATSEEENMEGKNFHVLSPDSTVFNGYGISGAVLAGPFSGGAASTEAPGYFEAFGSWAVTAP